MQLFTLRKKNPCPKKCCQENVNKHNFLCIILLWHYWVFHAHIIFPQFSNFWHASWNASSEKIVSCRIYEIIYPNLTKNYIIYHWNKNIWNKFDALNLIRRKRYFTQWFSVCSVGKIRFANGGNAFRAEFFVRNATSPSLIILPNWITIYQMSRPLENSM